VRRRAATFVAIAAVAAGWSVCAPAEDAPRAAARIGAHDEGADFFYGGFELCDNLSLEVSLRSDDEAVDLNSVAGSSVAGLDTSGSWNTLTVKAVGDLPLPELLSWRRDWRLFGTVGYYRSDIDRTVANLDIGTSETVVDDESRLQFGTRVLYKLGFVDLRGYVKWYGVFDDHEAWDAGGGVQLHF